MNLLEEDEMKLLNRKKSINPLFMKSGLGLRGRFFVGRKEIFYRGAAKIWSGGDEKLVGGAGWFFRNLTFCA